MFDASFTELLLVFVIGLLILGPERLPRVAAQIGRWVARARRTANQLRYQLEREVALDEINRTQKKKPPRPADTAPKAGEGGSSDAGAGAEGAGAETTGAETTGAEAAGAEAAETGAAGGPASADAAPARDDAAARAAAGRSATADPDLGRGDAAAETIHPGIRPTASEPPRDKEAPRAERAAAPRAERTAADADAVPTSTVERIRPAAVGAGDDAEPPVKQSTGR